MCQRILAGIILSLTAAASHAASYSFTTFDHPDATDVGGSGFRSRAFGINDDGEIVGTFRTDGGDRGYFFSAGMFTTFDDDRQPRGMNNNGDYVGFTSIYDPDSETSRSVGFVNRNGTMDFLEHPDLNTDATYASGIDDSGQIVGYWADSLSSEYSFLYSAGEFTPLSAVSSLSSDTFPSDINNSGQVVGSYFQSGVQHGFLYQSGSVTILDHPNAGTSSGQGTFAGGINEAGQIVGGYYDVAGILHGFIYDGSFTTIDNPNLAGGTYLTDINNHGEIIGSNWEQGQTFLNIHSFIGTPVPIPAVGWLLTPAFGLLGWRMRRRLPRN
jgi:probable HAF family extracellular repeat protein